MDVRFTGRALLLSQSLPAMRRPLAGETRSPDECTPLRDDASSDEIAPTTVCPSHDERLGRFAHDPGGGRAR